MMRSNLSLSAPIWIELLMKTSKFLDFLDDVEWELPLAFYAGIFLRIIDLYLELFML